MLSDRHARRRLVAFVVLVGLCLVMLVVSGSAPVQELRRGIKFAFAPVQDTLSDGTRSVTSVLGAFTEVDTLRRENEELQVAVDRLEDQLATLDAITAENRRLNKLLKTKNGLDYDTIAVGVSARYASQYERVITLDSGSEVGIRDGAPVVSQGGALAGRVSDVGEGWAEVTLISDTSSLVAGRDNRTKATGMVAGRLSAPLAMEEIPRTDTISINDRIVTLGANLGQRFRSVYPKGIPIGRVVDVLEEPGDVVKTALIQPEADLEHLDHVLVLTDFRAPKRVGDGSEESTEE
ncbi:MAG: rod shape-determining protein MreC [Chloroflexota bacterium]|nr:rod shape-determining protein MreC [Chloroflexota bacterium]